MTLAQLAYDAAKSALERQERVVDELRGRTGVLIGAAAVAVSFLGGDAFSGGDGTTTPLDLALIALALVSFLVLMSAASYVLTPRSRAFVFGPSPMQLYERLYSFRNDERELARRLGYEPQPLMGGE